ncbi:pitrilysin family protein [Bacillaceae bacterium]
MEEMLFVDAEISGIGLHVLQTKKFKTNTIVVNVQQALDRQTVTKTALLPYVLQRGSQSFPTPKRISEHLDDLYGAIFDVNVFKKGERQIIQFRLDIANEKYLADKKPLLQEGIRFIGEILSNPLRDGDAFSAPFVKTEKEALRKRIESLIDDKIRYANQRVTEEMCANEPYRYLAYGVLADIEPITPEELYAYYKALFAQNPIDVYVIGDVEPERVREQIGESFQLERAGGIVLPPTEVRHPVEQEKEVVERLNVKQGKLNIGCRTQIGYADDDYPALLMYNGILGAFPHSKLFINVREKASLAYYAVSRLESHKGLLMMMSGIEIANYEKAVGIMKEQLSLMREGKVSPEEMEQTKATLANQLRETLDSAAALADFAYNGRISGRSRSLSDMLNEIEAITLEDIRRVAEKVQIDTIYFLRDKERV